MLADAPIDLIAHVSLANLRHCFGPGEGRAFAIAVIGRLLPGIEAIEPLLALANSAQVLPVHVDTVSASIDLGSPQLDEMQERLFQATLVKVFFGSQHGLVDSGGYFPIGDSIFHESS